MNDKNRLYLTKEEQLFLMEMFELKDAKEAAERFVILMIEERADPTQTQKFIKKIMKGMK